jgi:two-component system, OmpR family, catabolic regulation response regulator CreB
MKPRVLIIEDERAVADAIIYSLRTDGCEPTWVSTGGEGLAALSRGGVDLIVLDIGLPDGNGFDFFRDIRRTSKVPVIFLTARSEEVDRVAGLEMGADDYVSKPFSPRELAARVRAVLRRVPMSEAVLNESASGGAGPFRVDKERRQITFFGSPLDLTRYEYRILEVLLRHPGWVYSREALMEQAWDDPSAALDRTVDSHIKSLRAKLKAVREDCEPIETRRGEGYSVRERW